MNNSVQIEIIQTAFNALVCARAANNPIAEVRAESRLDGVCRSFGMSENEPIVEEWAAIRLNDLFNNA